VGQKPQEKGSGSARGKARGAGVICSLNRKETNKEEEREKEGEKDKFAINESQQRREEPEACEATYG